MGVACRLALRGHAGFPLEAIDGQGSNQQREIGARRLTGAYRTMSPNDESHDQTPRRMPNGTSAGGETSEARGRELPDLETGRPVALTRQWRSIDGWPDGGQNSAIPVVRHAVWPHRSRSYPPRAAATFSAYFFYADKSGGESARGR